MFKLVNNTFKGVVKANNINLLSQQFNKISINNNCTYKNNDKRFYSAQNPNEDSKIGYLTSESNLKKVLDEGYHQNLKTKEDYVKLIEQETIAKKPDTQYDYTVRTAIPRPEADEMYSHPFTKYDIGDNLIKSQLPKSDYIDNSLLADTMVFKPFNPKRPFLEEPLVIDGVSSGYSKRKRSRAVAKIKLGSGKLTINGRTLADYFPPISFRDAVLQPLVITETIVKWDVDIHVFGGGLKGQAEAARRALGLALVAFDLGYRPALKASGVLKADARKVERKKPGQLKARKKFPLVKR
ncbi:hypothetical protein DICPUDRAFT_92344 [Dictyostelium purpureum]|uniref:30S ribosomal protein S9 n=1 Tax=Dictyostelium purpureum TaxID=5786 RepID=F0ZQD1_DICPU|nr:uncharacterized protein DICPUDRAFT_92344 [Dictyostelium purpureum]EGC33841.1 hypothetical protein DICPUDRAFT_92344 [Dictyostelium purpureum]|eukprot:XP_003289631.1 hypothetical protein DICPUDRAFT_92344 [Dictyostelium purpureum]